MSNVIQIAPRGSDIPKQEAVNRLAAALYAAKADPSDEPEILFHQLYSLDLYHWKIVSEYFEDIRYELGQLYIAAEIGRAS